MAKIRTIAAAACTSLECPGAPRAPLASCCAMEANEQSSCLAARARLGMDFAGAIVEDGLLQTTDSVRSYDPFQGRIMLRRIDRILVRVPNLDSAVKYYRDTLGLRLLKQDARLATFKLREADTELVLHADPDLPADASYYLV